MKKDSCVVNIMVEEGACMPVYATEGAAAADIRAYLTSPVIVQPGKQAIIPTGLYCEIPSGFEIQVRPRSGLAAHSMITVGNSPGTIDADYRGEIKVILINHGQESFTVTNGMRIAQIVLSPVYRAQFCEQPSLSGTPRGAGGFGHTGTH
jgi:dUTP pyrophosphatase